MAPKLMVAIRLDPELYATVDRERARLARQLGREVTRTEWCTKAIARQALTGSARPHPVDPAVESADVWPTPPMSAGPASVVMADDSPYA